MGDRATNRAARVDVGGLGGEDSTRAGRIIPLWIFTAFRACCQSESYFSSETAKSVQETQITEVLSQ